MRAEIISNLGYITNHEKMLWVIILFLFMIAWGFFICLEWRIRQVKDLREANENLNAIINLDIQNFMVGKEDFPERLNYLKKCMDVYRHKEKQ